MKKNETKEQRNKKDKTTFIVTILLIVITIGAGSFGLFFSTLKRSANMEVKAPSINILVPSLIFSTDN